MPTFTDVNDGDLCVVRALRRRPIPSAPGFHADANGTIYAPDGHVVRASLSCYGYWRVSIRAKMRLAHRLVCEAFHGAPPTPKHQAAHFDGSRSNNRPENLRWATPKENHDDRRRHGTHPTGEGNPRAVLTAGQVAEIRAAYAMRMPGKRIKYGLRNELADRFGVSVSAIKDVALGRSWSHQ